MQTARQILPNMLPIFCRLALLMTCTLASDASNPSHFTAPSMIAAVRPPVCMPVCMPATTIAC